jgi:hypothetical protein
MGGQIRRRSGADRAYAASPWLDSHPTKVLPLARDGGLRHPIHMKRTNLVLRGELLEEATRLSGEKTYSRTVDRALEEFVRRIKARQILSLAGSGLWEGDLGQMRKDSRRPANRRSRK